jgi:hypothetical protein
MTDGQSVSLSRCQVPIWSLRPDFCYCQTISGLLIWGALSEERTGLSFTLLQALARAVIFGSESRGTRDLILLLQIRDFPFRRLLRFAGLRWRYSNPPPRGSLISLTSNRTETFTTVISDLLSTCRSAPQPTITVPT